MRSAMQHRQKLGWEISAALVIKIAVLYLLWLMFFSTPIDDDLTGTEVGLVIFGTTNVEPTAASSLKEK